MTTRIGFDFRALQIGHQYRGIGEVVRRVSVETCKRLDVKKELIFFQYEGEDIAKQLGVERSYRTVILPPPEQGKLTKYIKGGLDKRQERIIKESCDIFIQYDFELGLPKNHTNLVVIHDQIPYIFGNLYPHSYLSDYSSARRVGINRKDALKKHLLRKSYKRRLQEVLSSASAVLTVSDNTGETTKAFMASGKDLKTTTMHLGHSMKIVSDPTPLEKATNQELEIAKNNFLFFVGGVDERRRIDELVAAFNQLRGVGVGIKLVLAGYDFQSLDTIYSPTTRRAIEASSYKDDIHLLGFISDGQRNWLYKNALAFVFPSEFEGFGIPVIESLAMGCPVITYSNSSLRELAGPNVYLASDWHGIYEHAVSIYRQAEAERVSEGQKGEEWAATFSWENSAKVLVEAIEKL